MRRCCAPLIAVFIAVSASLRPASAEPLPRSVLILDQTDPNAPWGIAFRGALRRVLAAERESPITQYVEVLDLARFGGPRMEENLRNSFREKYRDKAIGVIAVCGSAALPLAMRARDEIWPAVPIVFGCVDQTTLGRIGRPRDTTGVTFDFRLMDAVNIAKALVPQMKQIAHVGSPLEKQTFFSHLLAEVAGLPKDIEFVELASNSMADVKRRVSELPDSMVLFYSAFYFDERGVLYNTADALTDIAAASRRPILTFSESQVGLGAIGGPVTAAVPVGQRVGQLVLRVMNGENASSIPVAPGNFVRPVFDWRQLQRFGISTSSLPPGSEVRFRPPTMWEQYRWQLTAIFAAILLQSLMISGLLVERRRRRAVEAQLRNRLLEVVHLNRIATAAALSTSIAHELNQPLGAILNNAETAELLLKASNPDLEQIKEIVADIRRDDQRAGDVIKHLRGLLKRGDIDMRELDLNAEVRNAISILDPEATKRGVELKQVQNSNALPVRADPVHVQQVILNLAINGMDAMQGLSGARMMSIETAMADEATAEVSVSDCGAGIPADKLTNIFETFYTTKPHGTGLGLSIARTIVETYGGRIWAENRAMGGASFRFTLPLARVQGG